VGTAPRLLTERLTLRAFRLTDADDVRRLAGDREVATTTLNIPHPYEAGMAETWIGGHEKGFDTGTGITFAITLTEDGALLGAISLMGISRVHRHAELGYWIGRPFWGHGFCTEAGRAVVNHGFDTLNLNRIHAHHFGNNPASGAVMKKVGLRHEGQLDKHICKWDEFQDIHMYGLLRVDHQQS
jgi:[ribosomal protein S5]-alanine N-acetyltransferase